jgi:hypothetical protein
MTKRRLSAELRVLTYRPEDSGGLSLTQLYIRNAARWQGHALGATSAMQPACIQAEECERRACTEP